MSHDSTPPEQVTKNFGNKVKLRGRTEFITLDILCKKNLLVPSFEAEIMSLQNLATISMSKPHGGVTTLTRHTIIQTHYNTLLCYTI